MFFRRCFLVSLCFLGLSHTVNGHVLSHVWSQRFGELGTHSARSVAVDGSGSVVLTGDFNYTLDFGGGPLTWAGDRDIFLVKFDPSGKHLWSKSFGDASWEEATGVAVDGSGSVIVTGFFYGTVDFGGGPLTSAGGDDIFVVKFDANGNHLWSESFGDASWQGAAGVAVDASGSVVVTGGFYGTVDFGGGPLVSAGYWDIFVVKFDANGNHLWSKSFGDEGDDGGSGVAVDASGSVIVAGEFCGTVDFGGGPLTCAGWEDIFVVKFGAEGDHLWSKSFGDADPQYAPHGITVDASGNVVLTGGLEGAVDFGGGPLTNTGYPDIYVVKFDPSGDHLWSKRFGNEGYQSDWGESVGVDGSGNVIVTGYREGTVDFGGGPLTGWGLMFVVKFDPNGNHLWSKQFGDGYNERAYGVAVDGSENVIVTGFFSGTVDFGGRPLNCVSGQDIFIVKFGVACANPEIVDYAPTYLSEAICPVSATCGVFFYVDTQDDYSQVEKITLERNLGPLWIPEDSVLAPLPPPNWMLTCWFNQHYTDGEHLFRAVFHCDDGSRGFSNYAHVTADRGVPVTITNFEPEYLNDGVMLHWTIGSGVNLDGFNLYRSLEHATGFQRINDQLIPSDGRKEYIDNDVSPGKTYWYRLGAVADDGEWLSQTVSITVPTTSLVLHQNRPNPFNPETVITYVVPNSGLVDLGIYDAEGRLIRTLVSDVRSLGEHTATWDGRNERGAAVSSGIYLVRLEAGGQVQTRKIALIK